MSADLKMLLVEPGPAMVVIGRKARSKWWDVVCFGRKRHYRKDGSCMHTEAVLGRMLPEIRKRARVTPFGARGPSSIGASTP